MNHLNSETSEIVSRNEKIVLNKLIEQNYDDAWMNFVKCIVAVPVVSVLITFFLYMVFK